VTVVTADESRNKKEAIYNPYGQITGKRIIFQLNG